MGAPKLTCLVRIILNAHINVESKYTNSNVVLAVPNKDCQCCPVLSCQIQV
jgi:hypothetical protein